MKTRSIWSRTISSFRARKFTLIGIMLICIIGGYGIYKSAVVANTEPQYVISPARIGSIVQSISGTGQVSASNQTDIQSQVSGTITGIDVSVGQSVSKGQLIATIDSKNAAITLQNAKLSYEKLVAPPKATDLSNAQNSLEKSYTDAYNAASNIYLDLPDIVAGMKDLLYGQSGFLSDQRSSYLNTSARTYRDTGGKEYDSAVNLYQASLDEFKMTDRSSSTSTIDKMLSDTYTAIQAMSKAISDTQVALTFITTTQPDYYSKDATAAATNITAWASKANNDLSSLSSAQNSIDTSVNSYTTLVTGADQLDLQQAQLTLQQAEQTYENYFVRAPYDGVIGRIPVNVYGQASGAIATIIGKQKVATISLDEVDAAKVKQGQEVDITFDAIDNIIATGTVSEVDLVGAVSQGVVSYGVKILINTEDPRIKPGMSVNTTIITEKKDNVLIVPSAAIKTQAGKSFVQTFDSSVLNTQMNTVGSSTARSRFNSQNFASSTRQLASSTDQTGSSTRQFASSTRQFSGSSTNALNLSRTISSAIPPTNTNVTLGLSDDTNTEITSGLERGQLVVTRTIGASSAQTTAPSILNSLGARGGGGGGGGVRAISR